MGADEKCGDAGGLSAPEVMKPLHAQVAEALGCKTKFAWGEWQCNCKTPDHSEHTLRNDCHSQSGLGCDPTLLAHYDTDWAATGPLIEKYRIGLSPEDEPFGTDYRAFCGDRMVDGRRLKSPEESDGPTPLIAVCNLILALAVKGRL